MAAWPAPVLAAIAGSDDLHISPFRADGVTYGTPTWIWSVVVDGALYVRARNGVRSRWHRSAMSQRAGRISAGGHTLDVTFTPADASLTDAIDAAYRAKYADSRYLPPMVSAGPQAATVRIDPAG
ncbi:DUF2255 family protein [Demequina maris]|uniref:DUF2255 family protein n=1 Tax=Demequina maris TaxID=1638982 RepID=UPI000782DA8F|nr:DUF2255 family protein [Demequina maris]